MVKADLPQAVTTAIINLFTQHKRHPKMNPVFCSLQFLGETYHCKLTKAIHQKRKFYGSI